MAEIALPGDWTGQFKGSEPNLSDFSLSFSDEFDTMDVVPNNGTGTWFAPVHAPYGNATFMSPVGATNPFSVSDGELTITMKQVDGVWQSGTMQTVNSAGQGFTQEYGYFEMRAAFHGGAGAWPAFWMLSPDQHVPRVEVDIVEAYGGDPDGHHQAVHVSNSESHAWESNYTGLPGSMFDGAFHTYGARITTDWITIYYDGKELSRFPMSDAFRTPLYMLVSLAMNPLEFGQASGTYSMVVDYVRAYAAPGVMEQHLTGTDAADVLSGGDFDDVLDGGAGADKMSGGFGNDTYRVDSALDVIIEAQGAGIDLVITSMTYSLSGQQIEQLTLTGVADIDAIGNELDNRLIGNSGSNLLDGGLGIDKMEGGAGNDTYYVDNALDRVVEVDAGGIDRVFSSITYSLPGYVENLTLMGVGNINAQGNSSDNELTGNDANNGLGGLAGNDTIKGGAGSDRLYGYDGADLLDGGMGADLMNGGAGNDTYYVDDVLDNVTPDEAGLDQIFSWVTYSLGGRGVENLSLIGNANINAQGSFSDNELTGNDGNNTLDGLAGNDTIKGGAGSDRLGGHDGADLLDGGTGADTMLGGAGNDTYYVDDVLDNIADEAGLDQIFSSVSYSLSDLQVENLSLIGTSNTSAGGNSLDNKLVGNVSDNILLGLAGEDFLDGGEGSDQLNGGDGLDTLTGGTGDDVLDGGAGYDVLIGGYGNDRFYLGSDYDAVIDTSGTDTISSTISRNLASYSGIENLTLLGSANISGTGNALNNVIVGNTGANVLNGGTGNDTLLGFAGNDRLIGGHGNDRFYLGSDYDAVIDTSGTDTISSTISRNLASYSGIENLTLLGSANISGTGNALNNVIVGNTGANVLNGGTGNDTLLGFAGNDRLIGGHGNDRFYLGSDYDAVIDTSGTDTISSTISRNLASYSGIENLTLLGSANISGTGNALNNVIVGNTGANVLNGGTGNDTLLGFAGNDRLIGGHGNDKLFGGLGKDKLFGGLGNDKLTGGGGNDIFVINTKLSSANIDTITDFRNTAGNNDSFQLENAVLKGLGSHLGKLSSAMFWKSASGHAHDASDRIIYETDTGWLNYDSNGSVAGGFVHIAHLAPKLALSYADFVVI